MGGDQNPGGLVKIANFFCLKSSETSRKTTFGGVTKIDGGGLLGGLGPDPIFFMSCLDTNLTRS